MNVSSILELYTTGFGWAMYGTLFTLLAGTGLLAYPFLMLVYESWRGGSEKSNTMSMGSLGSLQTMKWGLAMKLLVFVLAVMPIAEINLNQMQYNKQCDMTGADPAAPVVTRVNDTSALADVNRAGAELVGVNAIATNLPVVWLLVQQIAGGVNAYMISNIPCIPDLTRIDSELTNVVINDAAVKKEYHQFVNECYAQAKSRFENATGGMPDAILNYANANNIVQSELLEIDSEIFKNVPGFYDSLRAKSPVPGIPYSAARDTDFSAAQVATGDGQPNCKAWWGGATGGLRNRLADSVQLAVPIRTGLVMGVMTVGDLYNDISTWSAPGTATAEKITKYTIRAAIRAAPTDFSGMYRANDGNMAVNIAKEAAKEVHDVNVAPLAALGGLGFGVVSMIPGVSDAAEGVATSFASFYASLYIIERAAPMMQAMILMLIYIFLPVYLLISKFEFDAVLQAAALIFTVKMFSLIFAVADYLDDSLYAAMYPDLSTIGTMANHGLDRIVLMVVVMSMYIFGPAFLLYLVTMAGANVKAGGAGDSSSSRIATAAGGAGGSLGRGAAKLTGSSTKSVTKSFK